MPRFFPYPTTAQHSRELCTYLKKKIAKNVILRDTRKRDKKLIRNTKTASGLFASKSNKLQFPVKFNESGFGHGRCYGREKKSAGKVCESGPDVTGIFPV